MERLRTLDLDSEGSWLGELLGARATHHWSRQMQYRKQHWNLLGRDVLEVCVGRFFVTTPPNVGAVDKEFTFWGRISNLKRSMTKVRQRFHTQLPNRLCFLLQLSMPREQGEVSLALDNLCEKLYFPCNLLGCTKNGFTVFVVKRTAAFYICCGRQCFPWKNVALVSMCHVVPCSVHNQFAHMVFVPVC